MLAYLFWHRPRAGVEPHAYEQAQVDFHRSLAHSPPVGLLGTAGYRLAGVPWLEDGAAGYEDWYLVEDYAALGVLAEAAVGRGHRSRHDRAAAGAGSGAGGLYRLVEGAALPAQSVGDSAPATWVTRPAGSPARELGELLGDGADPASVGLWRRQLVLGPAPEYCVLAPEPPAGVSPARLPRGWGARVLEREVIFASA